MALTAALATALAAISAAAVTGAVPALLLTLLLVPGVALTAVRPDRRITIPAQTWRLVAAIFLFGAFGLLALRPTPEYARYLVWLAVPLSFLWPSMGLRPAVFAATASLLGAGPSLAAVALPLAGFAAAAAVALVATNRMPGAAGHRLAGRGRGTAADTAALLAIAGVIALLAAALLPAPENSGQPSAGRSPRRSRAHASDEAPYLQPTDTLDAGAGGTGKGDHVVFRVTAPRTALWRTMTFDAYDGRTWSRTFAVRPFPDLPGMGVIVAGDGQEDFSSLQPEFVQRIQIEAPAVGVLPAAARLARVDLPDEHRADVARDGTVLTNPQLGKGAVYVATSFLPPSDADELRGRSVGTGEEDVPDELAARYLGFDGATERVAQLAGDIAGAADPTEYDRVHAIETWLRANTAVALDAPAVAPGADPIDQFLFTDRRGSATQAASAMAVMLRSLDIPARVAVGYVSPRPSPLGGEMVVRARHAHAWVEAWFPTVGWAAFDPAGRFSPPGEDIDSFWSRLKRLLASLWWLLALAVLALALWLGARWLRRRRQRQARPWATRTYERITAAGEKQGRPRRPGETPVEYCAALGAKVDDDALAARLVRVGELVSAAAWSPHEPPPDERAWADEVVDDLQASRGSPRTPG